MSSELVCSGILPAYLGPVKDFSFPPILVIPILLSVTAGISLTLVSCLTMLVMLTSQTHSVYCSSLSVLPG